MSSRGGARGKWQESGGKVAAAAKAAAVLQNNKRSTVDINLEADLENQVGHTTHNLMPIFTLTCLLWQVRRARGAYAGLFILMVVVWSTILISAIFSLRVNKESCEYCPKGCACRGSPPAWG